MVRPKLNGVSTKIVEANVFLNQAKGLYDRSAKVGERLILLEGSLLEEPDLNGWIYRDLESLLGQGFVVKIGRKYIVKHPISGITSGTAASVLGVGFKPAGYRL
ncbi:hypothetical protein [Paenibacillus gallinarum]|uniref:Uncharacterized protein n=1 Tax=Paenibacillus gallinarum TaxID=2762232 RepID=A0ABR8T3S7_9BACL|nr:hypothetical protein [Paenibacillus gallinarum]MBD7970434.1 hypothetical protein [Paenibacillus gallinarum]